MGEAFRQPLGKPVFFCFLLLNLDLDVDAGGQVEALQ
jgi:hypothetical protein